jgi:uncharacterized protein (DUF433 family)
MLDYKEIITINPNVRSGKPSIRGMRITVYDILSMLSDGMTHKDILNDFPELNEKDIYASLSYAADKEHKYSICA